MPQPTQAQVHVNRPLTMISIAFAQELRMFIAGRVFASIPVLKQSDRYFEFPRENWFRDDAQKRGLSQESVGDGFDVDNTPNYFADVWALHKDIDDQIRANADAPLDLDMAATEFLTQKMLLRKEKDWASSFFTTGIWTGSTTGGDIVPGTKWDAGGSTPIQDIRAQMTAMQRITGQRPNGMAIPQDVWDALQDNADFIDRIATDTTRKVQTSLLATLLELDEVLVTGATENTAEEGAAGVYSYVMSDAALLYHKQSRPSLMKPSAGYTFSWTGLLGANAMGGRMSRFRMEPIRSDRVEMEMAFDHKQVAPDLGVFFNDVLT